jgi:hypothetical protein
MTRCVITGALISAVLTAGCGSTHIAKSGAPRPSQRTIHIRPAGHRGAFTPIFHGDKPFVAGDSYVVWTDLPGGSFESNYCVIAKQQPRRTFWCTRTYVLGKGQIVAAGAYDNAPNGDDGTIPIVGGSGAYEGARGTVTSTVGRRGGVTIRLR